MKKYLIELLGTMFIVLFGCGVAIYTNGNVIATSLAFGLTITVVYYSYGYISGCHLNPAVSLAYLIKKELSLKDFLIYIISQIIGGVIGALVLYFIFRSRDNLAANTIQNAILVKEGITFRHDTMAYIIAIIVEVLLSCVFISLVLGVNRKSENKILVGIVIGLGLVLVHLLGIGLTGTSVNPARSIGVAIFQGGTALKELWIFIISPLIGALLATLLDNCIKKAD